MTMIDDTIEATGDEGVHISPEAQAPEVGQAATEGSTPEPTYLDVDSVKDHLVKITVAGEEIEVPLSEVTSGYMRQADYTRKTQEVAQTRQEVETFRALQQALQNNPQATLSYLQQTYGVAAAAEMVAGAEAQAEGEGDWTQNDPVAQKLAALDAEFNGFREYQAEQLLNRTLEGLKARYGDDFDPDSVVKAAVERGIYDTTQLESVYKQMAFDRVFATRQASAEAAAADAAENARRQAAAAAASGVVTTGTGSASSVAAGASRTPSTVAEAWAMAKEQLAAQGLS
jgi:hypothetical protein